LRHAFKVAPQKDSSMTLLDLRSKTYWIAIGVWVLGGLGIAFSVLPAYSWLSTTPFPDVLAGVLMRVFRPSVAAVFLIYVPGSLVCAFIGITVSFLVGLLVPPARSSTGLWMGLIAGVTYLTLAITSGVQPQFVTFWELSFLVVACMTGVGAARRVWKQLNGRKVPT
jgi:hypothetical protein